MRRDSPRELASDIDDLTDTTGATAAQQYVDGLLADGWDIIDDPQDDNDGLVQVLDCDGWAMFVERGEIPDTVDVETLPVTSV
jgi:hypothetical protein